jgi:hypothetical protein
MKSICVYAWRKETSFLLSVDIQKKSKIKYF